MASHTLADINTPHQQNITRQLQKNISLANKEEHSVIGDQGIKIKNDVANEDLESLITYHNISGSVKCFADADDYSNKRTGHKPTTIELIGGIFCRICKLTYSRKKGFDDHYSRHGIDAVVYACVVCYKEFKSYPSFRGHCYTMHVIKDRHKCQYCSHNFSKLTSLKDHIKAMHTFKCSTCSKQFTSKKDLQVHQIIHNTSNSPPYHCQTCEVEITSLDGCKEHAEFHTVNIYSCPICNENIPNRDNALDHLIKHFSNTDEELSVAMIQNSDNQETSVEHLGGIACSYCPVVSKNRVEFDAHFSYEHGDKDIEYICVVCDKKFDKYSLFADHAYNHRSKDRFCCSMCLKGFPRLSMLATHMAVCTADSEASGKPFACSECDHRYTTEARLRRHLLDAHALSCLTCPVDGCQKQFATPKELIFHQNIHNSHQNWCRQCGLPFLSLASCEQHIDVHKRPLYVCPVCNRNYREKFTLTTHIAQHFASVLLVCKACGKVYDNRRNFTDHLKMHSEKKVHNCSYCGKGFPKLNRLQEHLNVHTGSKPYKCTICSKTFASYPNFATHRRRMHNLEGKVYQNIDPTSDDDDEINNYESVDHEEYTTNDINYFDSYNSEQDENLMETHTHIKESNMKLNYVYQVQDSAMGSETMDSIDQVLESTMKPETIDCLDQVQDSMEAEAIVHIDIEKELQNLENIPEDQNNDIVQFVDVLATHETIFDDASTEVPPNMAPSCEATNFPREYGPEFTIGDSNGFLDLDDHMLPHIDPLLTIKTEEFNVPHNVFIPPNMDAGTYQLAPKWEPPIFTKVCPEYPYGYGDLVDSNRLSMMNTDIF